MMDTPCAGAVFAVPTADAIYEATKMVANDSGVLYLIKNLTVLRVVIDRDWQDQVLL